jgi:hypothetical protein
VSDLIDKEGDITWAGFFLGVAIVIGILAVVGGIVFGAVEASNNHRESLKACIAAGKSPSECRIMVYGGGN